MPPRPQFAPPGFSYRGAAPDRVRSKAMAAPDSSPATFATWVLVHGSWHGAWCWQKLLPELAARGVPAMTFDLPGHGDSTEPLGGVAADAIATRDAQRSRRNQMAYRIGRPFFRRCDYQRGRRCAHERRPFGLSYLASLAAQIGPASHAFGGTRYAGHSPFLSMPGAVDDILARAARIR